MKTAKLNKDKVHELLDRKYKEYNTSAFIDSDPVLIPHLFSKKQDIEIIGFWTAMLAWGTRKGIISSAKKLIKLMDGAPHEFVLNHKDADLKPFLDFKHRTFNATDALYFIEFFQQYYKQHKSLEDAFLVSGKQENIESGLVAFHNKFFSLDDAPHRTKKHIATPVRKSTCKRINMFLRWMVRNDNNGVDFGIWKKIKPAQLLCPLDVHVDRVARKLGLIRRKQTDWQTVLELTENLKQFDAKDPVKYDYALFGIGVMEKGHLDIR
jgi:uncharacterized protein (TIGR02757 family)